MSANNTAVPDAPCADSAHPERFLYYMSAECIKQRLTRSLPFDYGFHIFMVIFLVFVVLVNVWEIYAIVRDAKLRSTRIMQVVLAISSADLFFGLEGAGYFAFRAGAQHSAAFHQSLCFVFGPLTWFALGMSLLIFAIAAYDRYRAICTFGGQGKLSDEGLMKMFAAAVIAILLMVLSPFAGFGRYSLQPSGAYCNGDFFDFATFLIAGSVIALSMGAVALNYSRVFIFIRNVAKKSAATAARRNSISPNPTKKEVKVDKATAKQVKIAKKLLILVAFFLICWAPSFLMAFFQVAGVPGMRRTSWVDILAAVTATSNSAFGPVVDTLLFPQVKKAMLKSVGMGDSGWVTKTRRRVSVMASTTLTKGGKDCDSPSDSDRSMESTDTPSSDSSSCSCESV